MDDGLGSLACLMALSALVASLVTWLLTRKAFETGRIVKKIPVSNGESDESEVVQIELDTSRKYYVSSSGRKLHIYPECLGRHASCPLQDVHSLCQSLHRPSQYFYTGGYTSLEEVKLQVGVKEFYTVPEYRCFHVEFDGGLDFLRCG